jgi:heavy metal sensor kinase
MSARPLPVASLRDVFRSLRARVTIWCGGIIALCLLAYSTAVGITYAAHVDVEMERLVHEDVELAIRSLVLDQNNRPSWPNSAVWTQVREEEGGGHWCEIWSLDGERLLAVGTMSPLDLGRPDLASLGRSRHVSLLQAGPVRIMDARVNVRGVPFVARAAVSESGARKEVRSLWATLAMLSLAVLSLGSYGGYVLMRRSLGPLARMAKHARWITAEHLHDRLPLDDAGTELNQLRDAFNETLARLERSFDGLRSFTAHASHELRTPLTVVRSVGEVGLSQPRSDAEHREVIGTMLEEVDRLSRLLDALLALARADAGGARLRTEQVDLSSLACEVVDRLAVLAEERAQRLEVRVSGPANVMGDRVALRQALQNLVDNAIKYAADGTRIEIRVRKEAASAVVEVQDEGPGIPLDHRDRVFERFYRGNGRRSREGEGVGLGLGLSIVKATAEAHGGRIDLESEDGVGSTFRLVIPRDAPGLSDSHKRSRARISRPGTLRDSVAH